LEEWEQTSILATLQRVVAMMEAGEIAASPVLVTGPVSASVQELKEDAAVLSLATDAKGIDEKSDGPPTTVSEVSALEGE
jgi:hypothetical protein